jgi:hypothetical protein
VSRALLICGLMLSCGKAPGTAQPQLVQSVAVGPSVVGPLPAVPSALALPSSPSSDWPRACEAAGSLRWLGGASKASAGVRVATPLAWAGAHVTSAGPACCAPWSAVGVTWTALDRFGQIAGTGSRQE